MNTCNTINISFFLLRENINSTENGLYEFFSNKSEKLWAFFFLQMFMKVNTNLHHDL